MFLDSEIVVNEHEWKSKSGKKFMKPVRVKICYFKCDNCGNEFQRKGGEVSPKRLNNNYKHFCDSCKDYGRFSEIGREAKIQNLENRIGEKKIDSNGYVQVYVGPKSSDKCTHTGRGHYNGSVREHILIMTEHLGRPLEKGEVVHHIDGDKTNNSIDNLQLMSVAEHNVCHASNDALVLDLYRQGIVGYDRSQKRYFMK